MQKGALLHLLMCDLRSRRVDTRPAAATPKAPSPPKGSGILQGAFQQVGLPVGFLQQIVQKPQLTA